EMHVTLVRKGLDVQVVGVVDVFADLQHQRQRMGRVEIGRDHLGDLVPHGLRDGVGMFLPVAVPLGGAFVVRPVLLVWYEILREAVAEGVLPVLFHVLLELLGGFVNVFRTIQMIDMLLELSAVDQSTHVKLPKKKTSAAAEILVQVSEYSES